MTHLAILGASGHGKVVADAALAAGWQVIVFFDDAWPVRSQNGQWEVVGNMSTLLASLPTFQGVIVAIGGNDIRLAKARELRAAGAELVTIIHPRSVVSTNATVGVGGVICAGAVVNIDSEIGEGVIINTGATVDHDCVLGNGVHVGPGAHLGGGVRVDECVWIGIGASIKHGVHIGRAAIIGGGAMVIDDVAADTTVVGVPARSC